MYTTHIRTALVSAITTAVLVISVQSIAQHSGHHPSAPKTGQAAAMQPGAKMLHEEMMRSAKKTMEGKMPMSTDTDKAFNLMMADHHAMGIRMAEIEVKHGNDSATKALARKIIEGQRKERTQLLALAKKAR